MTQAKPRDNNLLFVNIVQWNIEGIKAKFLTGDICQLIKALDIKCFCVSETKLGPDVNFQIKGFKGYQKNLQVGEGQTPHGGVAVYVKNGISSYGINLQTPLQAVAVSIKCHQRITVCSIYLPPNETILQADLQALIEQLPKPFLLLGDMNAHHPMWHDTRETDQRGEMLVNLIANNDIALLDKNKMTSIWKVDKSFSHIDLSICSTELLTEFHWDVYEEPLNSDHFPVILRAQQTERVAGGCEKWLLKKADWEKYQQETSTDEKTFTSGQEAATFLEKHIQTAASEAIPKSKGTGRRKSPPWWNGKCRTAIWKRKAAMKKYKRVTSRVNYNNFSKARAEAKKVIKASKRDSWRNFIDSINEKSTSKEVFRKFNILNNKHRSELVNTLKVNKEEVRVSNVPKVHKTTFVKELAAIGYIQTLKEETLSDQAVSYLARFETDEATRRALALDGQEVQGCTLRTQLLTNNAGLTVLDEPSDIADCLGRRFSHTSSTNSSDPRFKERKQDMEREELDFSTETSLGYNSEITMEEMEYALNLAKDSSPGPDEVCYSMLKNLAPSGKKLLLELYDRVLKEGKFPKQWKEALVIPILKEGKAATSPGSYRPIALTSCICKVFERILNRRLVWYLESRGYIDRYQSGFRKGRSSIDSLAALTKEIHDAFRRKQFLVCVFFDLEKAYDTCWKHLIMKELHRFGLRGELPKIIEDFLSDRSFRVKVGLGISEPFIQEMGVPQGGVLSCTLFSLAINTVARVIRGLVSYSLYVDDKRISVAGTSVDVCRIRIQRVLDELHRWTLQTGFRFSIDKTEWMVFYRNTKKPDFQFFLDGQLLKETTERKFLGLIFDRSLTWAPHIAYLKGKCLKALNIVQLIKSKSRGTDSKTLLRIYRAIVRSKLDYGCQIYGTGPAYSLRTLDPVHHKGLRISLGAYRTSPCESMCAEANEPELEYRRKMLQLQYYAKVKQFLPDRVPVRLDDASLDGEYVRPSNKPVSLGYSVRQLQKSMKISFPDMQMLVESSLGPWERPGPRVCLELGLNCKNDTSDVEYYQAFMQHRHTADVEVYTDGSKSEKGVGAGVSIKQTRCRDRQFKRRLHESASIFTAELYAIKVALMSLKPSCKISCVIYTDSRSALQALQGQSDTGLVKDIIELLMVLSKRSISITFCWVPGHAGIPGNEAADEAAKAAVKLENISREDIPLSDVKSFIKSKFRDKWRSDWEKRTEIVKLREISPKIRPNPDNYGLGWRDAWKVTRLRIGHTHLTDSYKLTGEERPWCIECEEPITVRHLLLECGNNIQSRLEYYDHQTTSIRDLLSKKENVLKVLKFLKEVQIYNDI